MKLSRTELPRPRGKLEIVFKNACTFLSLNIQVRTQDQMIQMRSKTSHYHDEEVL